MQFGVFLDGRLIGCFGLHRRIAADGLELGYWMHPGFTGRGLATQAAGLLTEAALAVPGITHVEIHHDKANSRSGAIPRRLGFTLVEEVTDAKAAPADCGRECRWRLTARVPTM